MAQKALPPVTEDQFRDAILKKLTDKDTAVDSTLKKFVQLVEILQRKKGENDEEVAKNANLLGQSILRELEQYQLDLAREELAQRAIELDIEHYEAVYREKEAELVKVQKEIEELRETLAQERSKKKNKEEYLALAKLIHELPKRSVSERNIEELKASLAEVESRNQDIKTEFEEKTRQFQLLLYAINMLSSEIGEKDKEKDKEKESEDGRGVKRKLDSLSDKPEESTSKKHRSDDHKS